jgi:hypothetical protein
MNDKREKLANTNIKELIKQFPGIGSILEEYQIDCLHCEKGTCRLDDIVETENFTMDEEIEIMEKIIKVLP